MKTLLIITGALALVLTGGCAKRNSAYTTTQTESDAKAAANRTEAALNDAADKTREAARDAARETRQAAERTADSMEDVARHADDNIKTWRLSGDEIRADLNKSGRVVREKTVAAGNKMATGIDNARITTSVKAKYAADRMVSALTIDADTNNGVVTLKGTANSTEAIARAIELALETDGVHQVVSLLTVK
jgi:hyperosmotically inducible protein